MYEINPCRTCDFACSFNEWLCNKNKGTLNDESILTDYHPLELWAFAARWAELQHRTDKGIINN